VNKVFQKLSYDAFTPRCEVLTGSRILSRTGLVFDLRWIWRTVYRNPIVIARATAISLLSLVRRGVRPTAQHRQFGLVHSVWTLGYYHWLTESLPRALILRQAFPDAVPLLPSRRYEGYVGSLKALGFDDVAFFPDGSNALVENPVVTECAAQFATTEPALLLAVRDRVKLGLGVVPAHVPFRRVYVSRRKSRGRFVRNEEEVVQFLAKAGFEEVCFEDLSFEAQVRLMDETRVLISIHGAALTNMMFMPPGGSILELLPQKNGIFDYNIVRNSFRHDPCYVRLAQAMGHVHSFLECRAVRGLFKGTHMADIYVDIASMALKMQERGICAKGSLHEASE